MWFGPTAELVSGGAEFTVKVPAGPVNPWPTPSKLLLVAGTAALRVDWTTGSGVTVEGCGGRAPSRLSFFSCLGFLSPSVVGVTSRSGGEVSWWTAGPESPPGACLFDAADAGAATLTRPATVTTATARCTMAARLRRTERMALCPSPPIAP